MHDEKPDIKRPFVWSKKTDMKVSFIWFIVSECVVIGLSFYIAKACFDIDAPKSIQTSIMLVWFLSGIQIANVCVLVNSYKKSVKALSQNEKKRITKGD